MTNPIDGTFSDMASHMMDIEYNATLEPEATIDDTKRMVTYLITYLPDVISVLLVAEKNRELTPAEGFLLGIRFVLSSIRLSGRIPTDLDELLGPVDVSNKE